MNAVWSAETDTTRSALKTRHQLVNRLLLAATMAAAAVAFPPSAHAESWIFQSPTGNIACHISETGLRATSASTTMWHRRGHRIASRLGGTVSPSTTAAGQLFSVATTPASWANYRHRSTTPRCPLVQSAAKSTRTQESPAGTPAQVTSSRCRSSHTSWDDTGLGVMLTQKLSRANGHPE